MPFIYNVSPHALYLDATVNGAVLPGEGMDVTDEIAVELCAGPDWSLEEPKAEDSPNPRGSRKTAPADTPSDPASTGDDSKEDQ